MKIKRVLLKSSLVLFLSFNISCRKFNNENQNIFHLENEFANNDPSWVWTENSPGFSTMERLSSSAPLVKRVQEMINHLDSIARKHNPEQMAKIPRPRAVVLVNDGINAFVSGAIGCVDFPSRLKSISASEFTSGLANIENVLFFPGFGRAYQTKKEKFECYKVEQFDIKEFIAVYNETKGAMAEQECNLELDETGQVLLVDNDRQCGSFENITQWDSIVFYTQSNVVYVYAGLLKYFSEEAVFGVLGHELAHMYRVHSSSFKKFEPYFFKQNDKNELMRPSPTNEYSNIQRSALVSTQLSDRPHFEPNAKVNPNLLTSMFELTLSIGTGFCAQNLKKLESTCKKYSKYSRDQISEWLVRQWNDSNLVPSESYLKFEETFLEFLSLISEDELKLLKEFLTNSLYYNRAFFNFDFSKYISLKDWFLDANIKIVDTIKYKPLVLQRMANVGLGYYTTEEEADEIGLELIARSGLKHKQAVSPWLHFLQLDVFYSGSAESEVAAKVEECVKMFNSQWNSRKVLLDYLNNEHHSHCYRLYNTDREWKAHDFAKFDSVEDRFVFKEHSDWKDLVATVESKDPKSSDNESLEKNPNTAVELSGFLSEKNVGRHACVLSPSFKSASALLLR
ncbi:MAG: M48 family metalloprotease [Oligoflexales bacterium]|nr:M48 family metalloprotease [Oligoflexales bacterium]